MNSKPKAQLAGVIPVVPTPFAPDGSIDFAAHARLVQFCIDSKVGGICLPAYGSEFYKLTDQERFDLVTSGVKASSARIPVVAQCNHISPTIAADMARHCESLGVDAISIELSHMFPFGLEQYLSFAETAAAAVSLPLLVQDWHPSGETVSAEWVCELHKRAPNFRYIKLEEPALGAKVRAIRELTRGEVSVFEGWGGLYTLELMPAGIRGVMPGVALADAMVEVFDLARRGEMIEAYRRFTPLSPYLIFCMQNMEHFHHVEKTLLTRRNLLDAPRVRPMTIHLDADSQGYLDLLVEQVMLNINRSANG